jgi:hypothetical protein
VPEIIRASGEPAVQAYVAFLNWPEWSGATRTLYRQHAVRFLRWAEGRGLTLGSIGTAEVAAYAAEVGATLSPRATSTYLAGIRAAFRFLVESGVLAENPCDAPLDAVRRISRERPTRHAHAVAAGFPLLDLLAMLGNMEERTLQLIFAEEETAVRLMAQVRSPDGPACPVCGADAGDDPPGQVVCPACAKPYTAITGTMFEGSPEPVRHWLFLIHQMYLAESRLSDDELGQRMEIDPAVIASLCRRIDGAVVQQGLADAEERKRAMALRDKELTQDDVTRSIIHYAELEAVRDRLLRARDEATPVADLPEEMSLDQAIETIEAKIAEEDRYVIWVKAGYLVRSLASDYDAAEADARPETAAGP